MTTVQQMIITLLRRDVEKVEEKLARARRLSPTHPNYDIYVPRYERELAAAKARLQAKVASA